MASPSGAEDGGTSAPSNNPKSKDQPPKPREYNPRWMGYTLIILMSLVCFVSISNVIQESKDARWLVGMSFGIITFSLSVLILLADRFKCVEKIGDFTKAFDGKLEGFTLLFFVVLWIVAVALLTKPGGLAYLASNIFLSCWAALAASAYTLNLWMASKDLVSFRQLTQLSATLKSWYALAFFSVVNFGSAVGVFVEKKDDNLSSDAAFAIALGLASWLISILWILIHYKFFNGVKPGGWLELATSFFLILVWTIGVAILTPYSGIAPQAVGSGCREAIDLKQVSNCTVIVEQFNKDLNETVTEILTCKELYQDDVPGSNLFLSTWGSLFSSINLTLRWKAAQALQFAQAAQTRASNNAVGQDDADEEVDDDAI